MKLAGRVAIVTGGGRGIGRGIACVLASNGAKVAVVDRNADAAKRVVAEIEANGGAAVDIVADVARSSDVTRMADFTVSRFAGVDILINNAGARIRKPFLEYSESDWQLMIDVNLTGPFLCCKAVVPHLLKRGKGKIVNLASIAGYVGRPERIAYCAAKGGVLNFTRALAIDMKGYNICVNSISPGLVESGLHAEDPRSGFGPEWAKDTLVQRWGTPEDVAEAALYLVSDESNFITGIDIRVDGGWLAARARVGEITTQ